jgi:hypothetical protein
VLLALAGREAPAHLGEDELGAGVGPAERDDLARLLDPEVGELGRGERDAPHPRSHRRGPGDARQPGVQRKRPS